MINLVGVEVFQFVHDHHQQHDGVLEAEAVKIENMIGRIRDAAN